MKTAIIPDIHADTTRLEWSLTAAGKASLLFLGDLIDGDPEQLQTDDRAVLETIRPLVEAGSARCILGNHELNAILYHQRSKNTGEPLRENSAKNSKQHASFLDHFSPGSDEALSWTTWMLEHFPLWYDDDGFRVVHACWSQRSIDIVKARRPSGLLQVEDLEEVAAKQSEFAQAVEMLVSGPEVDLPDGRSFRDKYGVVRRCVRLAWWQSNNMTWREAALSVQDPSTLPDVPLPKGLLSDLYPADAKPVLFGHYKMSGTPGLQSETASSLDFPTVPCVYVWDGEERLLKGGLVICTN